MKPNLRSATATDLPLLEEIERSSFPEPHWNRDDFLRYRCTVAEIGGRLAGFLVVRDTFIGTDSPGEREILNIAVDPAFRRAGIASLLLQHELQSNTTHYLEVRASNLAAQALYRKLGFREIGRREKYYQNPVESAIVMRVK